MTTGSSASADPSERENARSVGTDLDADLRSRIRAVAAEQQAGAERFGSTRSMLLEAGMWALVGAAIWTLTLLIWR